MTRAVNKELKQRKVSEKVRNDEISREIEDVNRRLDRYYDAFESGGMTASDVSERIQTLSDKKPELGLSLLALSEHVRTSKVSLKDVRDHVEKLRQLLKTGDNQTRKSVFRSFVDRIDVEYEQVTVMYRLRINKTAAPGEETTVLSLVPSGGAKETVGGTELDRFELIKIRSTFSILKER